MSIKSASRSVSITIKKGISELENQEVTITDENELNWRNIIFVPFGEFWQFALMISILVNSFWVIFMLAYNSENLEDDLEWMHHTMELHFALDVLLLLMHK